MNSEAKGFEASIAVSEGAEEIDMVINIGFLKEGSFDKFEEDIRSVKKSCGDGIILKVIIEQPFLLMKKRKLPAGLLKKQVLILSKPQQGFQQVELL